jgi:hypothetical protein
MIIDKRKKWSVFLLEINAARTSFRGLVAVSYFESVSVAPLTHSAKVGLLSITVYVNFVCSKQEGCVTADAEKNDNDLVPTIQTYGYTCLATSGNVPTMQRFASLIS